MSGLLEEEEVGKWRCFLNRTYRGANSVDYGSGELTFSYQCETFDGSHRMPVDVKLSLPQEVVDRVRDSLKYSLTDNV